MQILEPGAFRRTLLISLPGYPLCNPRFQSQPSVVVCFFVTNYLNKSSAYQYLILTLAHPFFLYYWKTVSALFPPSDSYVILIWIMVFILFSSPSRAQTQETYLVIPLPGTHCCCRCMVGCACLFAFLCSSTHKGNLAATTSYYYYLPTKSPGRSAWHPGCVGSI
jgi:hypothetical protein